MDGEISRLFWRPFQILLEGPPPPPFICQFLQCKVVYVVTYNCTRQQSVLITIWGIRQPIRIIIMEKILLQWREYYYKKKYLIAEYKLDCPKKYLMEFCFDRKKQTE